MTSFVPSVAAWRRPDRVSDDRRRTRGGSGRRRSSRGSRRTYRTSRRARGRPVGADAERDLVRQPATRAQVHDVAEAGVAAARSPRPRRRRPGRARGSARRRRPPERRRVAQREGRGLHERARDPRHRQEQEATRSPRRPDGPRRPGRARSSSPVGGDPSDRYRSRDELGTRARREVEPGPASPDHGSRNHRNDVVRESRPPRPGSVEIIENARSRRRGTSKACRTCTHTKSVASGIRAASTFAATRTDAKNCPVAARSPTVSRSFSARFDRWRCR